VEMSGIEPETFHMQSERSTTELHPRSEGVSYPIWTCIMWQKTVADF
jgi:hypothetical protein